MTVNYIFGIYRICVQNSLEFHIYVMLLYILCGLQELENI